MKTYHLFLCVLTLLLGTSCNDDTLTSATIRPEATGSFIDPRDGSEYHWVRFGQLEWTVENACYDTGNNTCTVYQPYSYGNAIDYTEENLSRYGRLYTHNGALAAVPEGWRLPTDEDWNDLETALGTSASEAMTTGWRGMAGQLMQQTDEGTGLSMRMGGFFNPYRPGSGAGYRFMGSYGYFWAVTQDESKTEAGIYYFYRRLIYNSSQVYRESIEPENIMLSVRFVRDTNP